MTKSNSLYDGLLSRRSASAKHLVLPVPNSSELEKILFAASRAPDHGRLVPFRFVSIPQEERSALADLLMTAAQYHDPNLPPAELARVREKALEGPMAIAMVARIDPSHPKISVSDQWLSAGCALENVLLAVGALGFSAAIKSGKHYNAPLMRSAFSLSEVEHVVGLIILGTASEFPPLKPKPDVEKIFSIWKQ